MTDEIILRFSVRDDGSPVIERVNKKIAETKKESQALAPGIESARMKMMDFTSTNAGLIAVLAGAGVALKKLYDTAKQGAEIDFAREKFDRLAQTLGMTSETMMDQMQVATKGTLSQMEAMASVSDLVSLGLARTGEEAIRLATVQAGLGMDMNQLVLALANQTTMRFDQLGLSVVGFDEKVQALEETGMSASNAFQEAFLQQAEEQLLKVGNAADSSLGEFKRFEAEFKNFSDEAKVTVAHALTPLIASQNRMSEKSAEYREILGEVNPEMLKQLNIWGWITPAMENTVNEYKRAEQYGLAWEKALEAQNAELTTQAEVIAKVDYNSLIQGAIDTTAANEEYRESQADIQAQIQELMAEKAELYPWERGQIEETQAKIDELSITYEENAAAYVKAMETKFAMMALEKIEMSDGLEGFTESEYEKARVLLETTDIATAAAFEQTQAMEVLTSALADGKITTQAYGAITKKVMQDGVVTLSEVAGVMDGQLGRIGDSYAEVLAKQTTFNEKLKASQNLAGQTWSYFFNIEVSGQIPHFPSIDRPPGGSGGGGQANQNFAMGGIVTGPGSGTSDSIMARVSAGEFVVRANAVQQPGMLDLLNSLNAGQMPGMGGGFVNYGTINVYANNATEFMDSIQGEL